LCQNGGLSVLSSVGKAKKSYLVKKEVWDGALSWCNSQLFCRQSSGWSLHKYFVNNPLDVKKKLGIFSWLCSSSVLTFSVLVSLVIPFKHPCTAHALFPERLSNNFQVLHRTFFEIYTKFSYVGSVNKFHQARITAPNKRT
jgi:hypothetical protein